MTAHPLLDDTYGVWSWGTIGAGAGAFQVSPTCFKEVVVSDSVDSDFGVAVARTQAAVAELLGGDPEPEKALWSRRDDVTLANPAGGFRRGWGEVEVGLDLAASVRVPGSGGVWG